MLAVLRTGAAYCLLDVRWPLIRRRDVITHIAASLVVGPERSTEKFGVRTVPVPTTDEGSTTRPDGGGTGPVVAVPLDAGACIYFTSGSSGTPKAALSPHRAVLRTVLPVEPDYPAAPRPLLATAAVSWDIFTFEVWYPLVHGGTTNLATTGADGYPSPQGIRRGIETGVDGAVLTSSLFNLVVDEDLDAFTGLGTLMIGGELSPRHVRDFLLRHPTVRLVNAYGPIEASVFATTHQIQLADCDSSRGIPIGRPISGTSLLVVNFTSASTATRVSAGAVGELLISGAGLAAGYLGEEPGTSAFTPISVDGEEPVRAYRTGDLVADRSDGVLEFVGRADRQLKIRGQRVEPAEVEAALLAIGTVIRACVVPILDGLRPNGLAAYVVPARPLLDTGALTASLRERLPTVMVPQTITVLPQLPLGPTGKVNIAGLPVPASALVKIRPGTPSESADPTTRGLAAIVARTAAEILGLESLGPDVDLRTAGLDSLAAIRLSHRLLDQAGIRIEADVVLGAGSAAAIAGTSAAPGRLEVGTTIAEAGGLSDAQTALWLDDLMRPRRAAGNVLVLAYGLTPAPDPDPLARALTAFSQRHEALRTAVDTDPDGLPVATLLTGPAAVRVEAATGPPPPAVQQRAEELAGRIDLATGPLFAIRIDPVSDGCELLVGVHHACFDCYCEAVLADELSTLLVAGSLPPAHRFADTRDPTAGRPPVGSLAEWTARLAITRDLDWPSPPASGDGPAFQPLRLPDGAGNLLATRARELVLTTFVLVFRAFAGTIESVTGARDSASGADRRAGRSADPGCGRRLRPASGGSDRFGRAGRSPRRPRHHLGPGPHRSRVRGGRVGSPIPPYRAEPFLALPGAVPLAEHR